MKCVFILSQLDWNWTETGLKIKLKSNCDEIVIILELD